jgi:hypothetical protein
MWHSSASAVENVRKKSAVRRVDRAISILVVCAAAVYLLWPTGTLVRNGRRRLAEYGAERYAKANWSKIANTEWVIGADSPGHQPDLVVFTDYECRFCVAADSMMDAYRRSGHRLVVGYRHLPLKSIHVDAEGAARAAICAGRVGRFATGHVWLTNWDNWRGKENFHSNFSAAVGHPSLDYCIKSAATDAMLQEDIALAGRLKLTGTPTFVSPNGMHRGVWLSFAHIQQATRQD